jgi:hypothetical protein
MHGPLAECKEFRQSVNIAGAKSLIYINGMNIALILKDSSETRSGWGQLRRLECEI